MKNIVHIVIIAFLVISCKKDNNKEGEDKSKPDNFNRKEMLTFWADDIIIPAYADFSSATTALKSAMDTFSKNPTETNLSKAKLEWEKSYLLWQKVSLFQVGKAEEFDMAGSMNTYPTDVVKLKAYIELGKYNLESPNLFPVQGFPALDYLLNGLGTDEETLNLYKNNVNYKTYLIDITNRIQDLSLKVYTNWKESYRTVFIDKDDYTTTSSVDKMVNYFVVPFYEKQFRNNKLAIPAGANTGEPVVQNVEAFYKKDLSKKLYIETLKSAINFYRGVGYNGKKGKSLQQYLEFLKRNDLANLINTKFNKIEELSNKLDDNFINQINNDRNSVLKVYDAVQHLLKSFKPDMMSAMSVMNTSTDADND